MPRRSIYDLRIKTKLNKIRNARQEGASMSEIARLIGIGESTLYNQANKHEDLREALDFFKPDLKAQVIGALYKKAIGFEYTDQVYNARLGKVLDVHKVIPPDTVAIKYWLSTQDPTNWREKKEIDLNVAHRLEDFFINDQQDRLEAAPQDQEDAFTYTIEDTSPEG
jgi:hypothetical protein